MKKLNSENMPWYYYVIAIIILLVITYLGLWLAGEVQDPFEFLLNLKKREL